MPRPVRFRRRYGYGNRGGGYPRGNRRYQSRLSLLETAATSIEQAIETKYWNTYANGSGQDVPSAIGNPEVDGTTNLYHLSGIGQGYDQSLRMGNQVRITGVQGRWTFFGVPSGTTVPWSNIRVMMILVKAWNGASTFDITNYLNTLAVGDVTKALYNYENRKNYEILLDKCIVVNEIAGGIPPMSVNFDFDMPLDIPVTYKGAGNPTSNVSENALFFLYYSNSGFLSPDPSCNGSIRVMYKDA